MEALKSVKNKRKVSETAEESRKVHWRCVVPGCKSNSSVKRHSFPKDLARSQEWRTIINNPELDELTSDELCHYRVCQLHFPENAYKITACRQVLKEDAVPQLNLRSCMPTVSHERPREIALDIDKDVDEDVSPRALGDTNEPSTSRKNIAEETGNENYKSTPKNTKKQLLLGSITRKDKLTPVTKRLHGVATNLLKKQSKYVKRLGTAKERLQSAEKYMRTVKMKELQSLSKEQRAFVEMHIRNVHKKAKAELGEECLPSCRFH